METGSGPIWDGEKWIHPGGDPQPSAPSTETPQPGSSQPTPPPDSSSAAERLRGTVIRHPLASAAVCLGIGAVLAAGITAAITVPQIGSANDERDNLAATLASTQTSLEQAQSARDQAQQVATRIRSQRDQIISDAQDRAASMISDAKDELSKLNGQVSATQDELSSTQSQLDSTQASLDQAQEIKAQSTFGNGTWQANVDYLPGTYQSDGGAFCYWEKLKGPSGGGLNNIIDNGGDNSQQIVSVDSPYFHTNGCGTWTKVG